MQRNKRIFIMFGVLIAFSVITFCVSKYETHKENIKNSDEIVLKIDTEKVTALSWEKGSKKFSFHKNENWIYDEDEEFPVNDEKIDDMLSMFKEFGASFIIENVEDLGQYGLDKSDCTIHITTDDKEYKIELGDYSKMDSQRYVSIGDGNVYLASEDPMNKFDTVLSNLIKHDEIPKYSEINDFSFSGNENYSVVREAEDNNKSYCKDDIYYVKDTDKIKPLDTDKVDNYFLTLKNLYLADYATYKASDADLENYGLISPALSVSVNYGYEDENDEEKTGDFSFSVGISSEGKEAENKAAETVDEDKKEELLSDITAYLRIGNSKIIYKIKYDDYTEILKASYNDLRHSRILPVDFDDIYKMEFTVEEKSYTIASEEKDNEKIWKYNDKEIGVSDIRSALSGLRADSFTTEKAVQKEEIRFTCYLDNENYPKSEIVLYRYDGKTCIATLDGETVAFVLREDVVDLIETVNAFALER